MYSDVHHALSQMCIPSNVYSVKCVFSHT